MGRFYAVRENAEVATQPERLGKAPPGFSIYARNNLWIINTAWIEAADSAKIRALLVWDQKPTGDGRGGTIEVWITTPSKSLSPRPPRP